MMTAAEFKSARKALCLSQRDLAEVWGMGQNGERTTKHRGNGSAGGSERSRSYLCVKNRLPRIHQAIAGRAIDG